MSRPNHGDLPITMKQVQVIHTAKHRLGIDDDGYRAMLSGYGVRTSKDLTRKQAEALIGDLQAKGFRMVGKTKPAQKTFDKQLWYIKKMWSELYAVGKVRNQSDTALNAFAKQHTGCDRLEWATREQKIKVIEALKAWQRR